MNEIASLAEKLGANVEGRCAAASARPAYRCHFLYAGVGYGGSCFQGHQALQHTAGEYGMQLTSSMQWKGLDPEAAHPGKVRIRFGEQLDSKTLPSGSVIQAEHR
jgi:UDPglucose 6-dehydrogenase